MQRRVIHLTTILSVVLYFIGCATPVKDYKPKSPDEEAIVSVLIKYEKAYNSGDARGCAALWSEGGIRKYGADKKPATKATLETAYTELMESYPDAKFINLRIIDVSDTSATVKLQWVYTWSHGTGSDSNTIYFIKENNQWLMNRNDY
jgi:hypothetical protein